LQEHRTCLSNRREHGSTGPALVVRNLDKSYGEIAALKDISFSVPGGSFMTLLGASGSGKTTVLRLLGGFEAPDGGRIEIGGLDISGLPPHRREIGMIFQSYALFPHMTVAENVAFPLRQRRVPRPERELRVAEILEVVGLAGFGERSSTQLSGGQQQRVALARALVFRPRVLLMDEPLAALDKRLREQLQEEIRKLQLRFQITTVYVTHDQTEAFAMSDLVAVMRSGHIEQIGTPRQLYEAPQTEWVAHFVGDSNLFRGVAIDAAGTSAIRLVDGTLLQCPRALDAGKQITLLVRPEKIDIFPAEAAVMTLNTVSGHIVDIKFLGELLHYTIRTSSTDIIVRKHDSATRETLVLGARVQLGWAVADTVILG
jgi:spermidine/putrescine ABC transporter ATP-binding subunit